jgi:D-glycero-D-manno-heptose 1,7-bisphosphate phosphatase
MTSKRKAVVLDRDGTLIDFVRDEETGFVTTAFHPSQVRLLPGVPGALAALQEAGFLLAIATNQPGPAKGHFSRQAVHRTNEELVAQLRARGVQIACVKTCMDHPVGGPGGDAELVRNSTRRKPEPGMLLEIGEEHDLDLAASWMIGDTFDDVRAGVAAGMQTALLLLSNRCELCPNRRPIGQPCGGAKASASPRLVAESLTALADRILDLDRSSLS